MLAPAAPPRAHGATCWAPVGCCALGGLHGGGAFLSAQQTRWQAAAERAGRHTVGLWTVSGVCVTRPETARPQRRWALRSGTRGGNMPGARPPTRPPLHLPLSKWPLLSPFHRVTASKITTLFLCRQLEFWPEDRVSQATRLSHEDVTLSEEHVRIKCETEAFPPRSCVRPLPASFTESLRPGKVFVWQRGVCVCVCVICST